MSDPLLNAAKEFYEANSAEFLMGMTLRGRQSSLHALLRDFAATTMATQEKMIEQYRQALEHYADRMNWGRAAGEKRSLYDPLDRRRHEFGGTTAQEALTNHAPYADQLTRLRAELRRISESGNIEAEFKRLVDVVCDPVGEGEI